ncbi:MAG: hypothetical protein DMF49_07900 [Acidobacteria bacterium]|nr:MAG: hypothetical protein DMF49_07900 [Acidobacteriota bacterium]
MAGAARPTTGTLIVLLLAAGLPAAPDTILYSDEEISAKYRAITPKDSDFKFSPPEAWGPNLSLRRAVSLLVPSREDIEAHRVVDGQPATTWTCRSDGARAMFVIDLGTDRRFDRVVVFNRQTEQRGTGGGNNAVKRIVISTAPNDSPGDFRLVGEYLLEGPSAVCFKRKAGGQSCAFVDRSEPNVIELPVSTGRYLKVELKKAFWSEDAYPSWKTSIAVSELMLFDSQGGPLRGSWPPETRDCRFDTSRLTTSSVEAAARFRGKRGEERMSEFKALMEAGVFPFTPAEQVGPNRFQVEYNRINCIMMSRDLRALLGKPNERRGGALVYALVPSSPPGKGEPRCNADFFVRSGVVSFLGFEGGRCSALFENK